MGLPLGNPAPDRGGLEVLSVMAVSRISVRQETREEAFVFLEQYRIEDLKQFVFFSYAYKTVSLRAPQPQRGGVEEAYVEPSGILKLRGPN